MKTEEYAQNLLDVNSKYPWIKDGKFVVQQGSQELIEMRQRYFFEESK